MKKVNLRRNQIVAMETNPKNATADQAKAINRQMIQKQLADETADEYEENQNEPSIHRDAPNNQFDDVSMS